MFARRNNDGAFFKVVELDNIVADNDPNSVQSFSFRNDGTYVFLSEEEINKLFDAVPRAAKAEAFSNNRLFYGNYKEGFDNIETNTYAYPVYYGSGEIPDADIEINASDIPDVTTDLGQYYYPQVYDLAADHPAWTYLINQRRKRPYNPTPPLETYNNMAIYGVGEGVSFNLDFSEYPEGGFETDCVIDINAVLKCNQFGIGTTSESIYISETAAKQARFPINVTRRQNGNIVHSETLYICTPSALYVGQDGVQPPSNDSYEIDGDYLGDINSYGLNYRSLSNLRPTNNVEFKCSISVNAYTTKTDLLNLVLNSMQGQQASCQVFTTSPSGYNFKRINGGAFIQDIWAEDAEGLDYDIYGYGIHINASISETANNYNLSCVATPNSGLENGQFPTHINNVFLFMSGSLGFSIEGGYIDQESSKINFNVKLEKANLSASRGLMTTGEYFNGYYDNQFKTDAEQAQLIDLVPSPDHPYSIEASIGEDVTNGWGWLLQDRVEGARSVRTCWEGFTAFGEVSILPEAADLSTSFKTGGLHVGLYHRRRCFQDIRIRPIRNMTGSYRLRRRRFHLWV